MREWEQKAIWLPVLDEADAGGAACSFQWLGSAMRARETGCAGHLVLSPRRRKGAFISARRPTPAGPGLYSRAVAFNREWHIPPPRTEHPHDPAALRHLLLRCRGGRSPARPRRWAICHAARPLLVGRAGQCLHAVEAGEWCGSRAARSMSASSGRRVQRSAVLHHLRRSSDDPSSAPRPARRLCRHPAHAHFTPGVHVNYAETVLPMRDGLPKLKDFPFRVGRLGSNGVGVRG